MRAISQSSEPKDMNSSFKRHAGNQSNCGALPCPDGYAHAKGTCGDSLEMFVYIAENKINTATFLAHGCSFTHACASALINLIVGRDLDDAFAVEEKHIETALNGLPREHRHCAELSLRTFRSAVSNYYTKRKAPWKSIY
jgi:nitrogen fixation protein NifU and related proteins